MKTHRAKPAEKPEDESRCCKSRWRTNKNSRISELRRLLAVYHDRDDDWHAAELGTLGDYGLAFDSVAPDTIQH